MLKGRHKLRVEKFKPSLYARALEKSGKFARLGGLLYEWTETHWAPLDHLEAESRAMRWIADSDSSEPSAEHARAAHQTALRWLSELPALEERTVIPVLNGYLYVEGGALVLREHDKELGLRHVLACKYDPLADQPKEFLDFIEHVLPDPDVRLRVQEYIGYTLLPDTRYQVAHLWIGGGANGKGVLANIVQALHRQTAAVQLDALSGFRLAGLVGASLAFCDEVAQTNVNEQIIKSLIAGEKVQIDQKYRDPISTHIKAKWLILGNHVPAVKDQSEGFWRRFDIVPFEVTIPAGSRDPMLAHRIIARELAGVLNWALVGLLRLLARGRFDANLPAPMRAAHAAARFETNSVRAFVQEESVTLSTTTDTPKTQVYASYKNWTIENSMVPVASPKFWKRLPDALGQIVEGRQRTRKGHIRTCNVRLQ